MLHYLRWEWFPDVVSDAYDTSSLKVAKPSKTKVLGGFSHWWEVFNPLLHFVTQLYNVTTANYVNIGYNAYMQSSKALLTKPTT